MNRHRKHMGLFLSLVAFILGAYSETWAGEPLELVKTAVDKVFQILGDPQLKTQEKKSERIERLKQAVNPIFDYDEMARRSLGQHWRKRTPAEQEEFTALFRAFLESVYSEKTDIYSGEKIVFGRETVDGDFAQVEASVINAKKEQTPVIFRLWRSGGKWKVYDAVVENISIVNNYRAQFERVISKSSYEDLKKMLKDKAG